MFTVISSYNSYVHSIPMLNALIRTGCDALGK